jgi:hypothetical protein
MADDTTQADEVEATTAKAFAAKATDLQALRDAVVDAANVGAGLWFSYLFVLLYLAIAVGAVTHRDLLFVNPVKLPFLNVELPLKGFFVLGPVLLLIVHAYVLLHLVRLAGKVGAFHAELQRKIAGEEAKAGLLRQLPSNIFVQFLAGPNEVAAVRSVQWLIAQVSLVFLPLGLLALFQVQFLPYHDEVISWWQRFAVFLDLVLLWTLWFRVTRCETRLLHWRNIWRPKFAGWGLVSLVPLLLVFGVATFPGERLDETLRPLRFVPTKWPPWKSLGLRANQTPDITGPEWISPHELLFAGVVDEVARRPTSWWSNRLVLPNIDVIDHTKFDTEAKIRYSGANGTNVDRSFCGQRPLLIVPKRYDCTVALTNLVSVSPFKILYNHFGGLVLIVCSSIICLYSIV